MGQQTKESERIQKYNIFNRSLFSQSYLDPGSQLNKVSIDTWRCPAPNAPAHYTNLGKNTNIGITLFQSS
jgi:hypothetical protein